MNYIDNEQCGMPVARRVTMCRKREITLLTISNKRGAFVELSTLGAGITRIVVPDRYGRLTDVVLGYEDEADYLYDPPCAGKTPGRFANRISGARFQLDGVWYTLTRNDGSNALHGGPEGFHNRIWDYEVLDNGVRFSCLSPDGEEGYPGNLRVSVTYIWSDDNTLDISYNAAADAPTVVNLTNHAYFNLDGEGSGDILSHSLVINGSRRVQADGHDIPTGRILPVKGTPFDFTEAKKLGDDLDAEFENLRAGKGYNHYFFIDGEEMGDGSRHAATLTGTVKGICLDIYTTLPGLMLYTGNWLAQAPRGRNGVTYRDHDGVAIECQFPPDAPNRNNFPSTVLRPGEGYHHVISYRFTHSAS